MTREAGARHAGIPLFLVVIGAVGLTAGTLAYGWWTYRSVQRQVYEDQPLAVAEVPSAPAAAASVRERLREGRSADGWVELSEVEWNQLLLGRVLRDPKRAMRIRCEAPFVRVELSQPAGEDAPGRYLNARLLVQLYAAPGGLGAAVRGGTVGALSLAEPQADWVRVRIERQLTAEWERDEALRDALTDLREVRVRDGRIALRFGASG